MGVKKGKKTQTSLRKGNIIELKMEEHTNSIWVNVMITSSPLLESRLNCRSMPVSLDLDVAKRVVIVGLRGWA